MSSKNCHQATRETLQGSKGPISILEPDRAAAVAGPGRHGGMRPPMLLSTIVLVAALFGAVTLRADGLDNSGTSSPPAVPAETFIPVPPVEGVPGPLFFQTPTLAFVPKGTVRITAGAAYLHGVTIASSGLAGDLEQLGLCRVDLGFSSRIEVRVQGIVRQRLEIDEDRSHQVPPSQVTGSTTHDAGDFSVITIARLLPERKALPAIGLRVEAKLPNTNEQRGIGTNTTDVILSIPIQKSFGKMFVVADAGLGILTEPASAQSQNDVLVYGFAAAYSATPRLLVSGELAGRWAPSGSHPGTGDQATLRAGVSYSFGPSAVGVLLSRGLDQNGECFGAALVFSYGFRVMHSIRPD